MTLNMIHPLFAATFAFVRTHLAISRRSGRTRRMLEAARDGDTIVVAAAGHVAKMEMEMRKHGKRCLIISADTVDRIEQKIGASRPEPGSAILFDHTVIEMVLDDALRTAQYRLNHIIRKWEPRTIELSSSDEMSLEEYVRGER